MKTSRPSLVVLAIAALLTLCLTGPLAAAGAAQPGRADFSGFWALNEKLGDDPMARLKATGAGATGEGDSNGRGGRRTAADGTVLPWEILDVDTRLTLADDGTLVKVTRANGQKRRLFGDGEERELDEGEGPAKVTGKRSGKLGEKIVVSISWSTGRSRKETWELLTEPRRLVLTAKVKDRESFSYRRVYEPTTEPVPTATPTQTPTPIPEPAGGPATAGPASPAKPTGGPCSLKPARGTSQADLSRAAKLTQAAAAAKATAFVSPRKPNSVISSDVEVRDGCLVWSFLLRYEGTKGVQEIVVDAGDGKILSADTED